MRLVRLLAAGKSVVGMRNDESPYRLTHERLLPNFGTERTLPFGAADAGGPAGTDSTRSDGSVDPAQGTKAPTARPKATAVASESARVNAAPVVTGSRLSRVARWLADKLTFSRSRSDSTKPARSPLHKPPVQGELSLDHITVVRNDLSDADLEVVRLRPKAAPASAAAPAAAAPASTGSAWSRATARLFK